ncbi:hypothetical protein POL68_24665 [Stigmatella sp. ncwal1]|uniref:Peptidase metallopeptidase domain-containing protein n=1 Tax=Stigmatella ashevillensis TaxID=2995309 RepID=A0ABT5DF22_9BACT|nr:hypothetical protein [Stigmatella ashevillena]MDC0711684.1 hypothetical protein [Stigmatella ashevillena]
MNTHHVMSKPFQRSAVIALSLLAMLTACGEMGPMDDPGEQDVTDSLGTAKQRAFYQSAALWIPMPSSIPVCWENPGNDATERAWVRSAIQSSWEANSNLRFSGWNACQASSMGIRIRIADENPSSKLGKQIDGKTNGMTLNFTFNNYKPSCKNSEAKRQSCIEGNARHEFGHAIGFNHEHNRLDTPADCTDTPQGSLGDYTIGGWDPDSVMNYCTSQRTLSTLDILAVRTLYGMSYAYQAHSTDSATRNTQNHRIPLLEGQTITLGTCGVPGSSGTGNTYLRLYRVLESGDSRVKSSNDASGCGLLSKITYTVPAGEGGFYELRAGCSSNTSCSGTVAYAISGGKVSGTAGAFSFSASHTGSATVNTSTQMISLMSGKTLTVGTCGVTGGSDTGDTYLRLFQVLPTGKREVSPAAPDATCAHQKLVYTVPTDEDGKYEIHAGCDLDTSCSGTVAYSVK